MFLKRFLTSRISPRYFVFEVTPRCNESCLYCYNVWKHGGYPDGEMDLAEWKRIVLKLKREGAPRLISLSGGEPLLWPGTTDLIRFIRLQGIGANLLTNGTFLDEITSKALVQAGVSLFQIPLIAPNRAAYEQLKGADNFDKVVEGMANIKQAGGRLITVFVATRRNIGCLKETLELSIALGSSGLMFNRVNPACKDHIPLMPPTEELKSALSFLNDFSKKHRFPVFCSVPVPPCVIDMKDYPAISHGYCPSGDRNSYYTVDSRGGVRICNHTRTIMGNLLEQDLSDIVRSVHADEFRKVMPRCAASCGQADVCRGGCKASAEVCYGRLSDNDPFVETNDRRPGITPRTDRRKPA